MSEERLIGKGWVLRERIVPNGRNKEWLNENWTVLEKEVTKMERAVGKLADIVLG